MSLAALLFIVVVTAGWWLLALWPIPEDGPVWLARAQAVCFNTTETGLPDASGWLLLIGQPLGMVAFLAVVWPGSLRSGLRGLAGSPVGRGALALGAIALLAGLSAASVRVVHATERAAVRLAPDGPEAVSQPRLDRAAPATELVDQSGARSRLADLGGRPVFVTFAFGNCETICPLVVHNVLEARERLDPSLRPAVVVVTLDPWRDLPARLPHLVEHWGLASGDRLLGGTVEEVETALDAWGVPRRRDLKTGDIVHPALVHLVDAGGRIAFSSRGDVPTLVALAERLQEPSSP